MAQSVGDSSDERLPTEMDKILNLNTENADKSYILLNVIQHLLEEVAELKQKLRLQEKGKTDVTQPHPGAVADSQYKGYGAGGDEKYKEYGAGGARKGSDVHQQFKERRICLHFLK